MSGQSKGTIAALRSLVMAADRFRNTVARALGVGPSDVLAMSQLRVAGPLSPREIAVRLGLTPSTVTALLRRLEASGLAQRFPHETDHRQVVVALTEEGMARLDQSEQWLAAVLEHMDMDPGEAERVLVALAAALDTQGTLIRGQVDKP